MSSDTCTKYMNVGASLARPCDARWSNITMNQPMMNARKRRPPLVEEHAAFDGETSINNKRSGRTNAHAIDRRCVRLARATQDVVDALNTVCAAWLDACRGSRGIVTVAEAGQARDSVIEVALIHPGPEPGLDERFAFRAATKQLSMK